MKDGILLARACFEGCEIEAASAAEENKAARGSRGERRRRGGEQ